MGVSAFLDIIITQAPALGILASLVIVVYMFLRAMEHTTNRIAEVTNNFQNQIDRWSDGYKISADNCHLIQDKAIEAIVRVEMSQNKFAEEFIKFGLVQQKLIDAVNELRITIEISNSKQHPTG